MTRPTEPARIAVLDIGKTNLKLLVASDAGRGWTDEGAAWRASSVGNNMPSSENCPAVVNLASGKISIRNLIGQSINYVSASEVYPGDRRVWPFLRRGKRFSQKR
jgi:hypothetical protein